MMVPALNWIVEREAGLRTRSHLTGDDTNDLFLLLDFNVMRSSSHHRVSSQDRSNKLDISRCNILEIFYRQKCSILNSELSEFSSFQRSIQNHYCLNGCC